MTASEVALELAVLFASLKLTKRAPLRQSVFTFAMALAGPLTGGRRGGGVCGWGGDWCVAEGRRGGGKGAVGGVREKGVGPL